MGQLRTLHIGVSAYDETTFPGKSLPGATNDAHRWWNVIKDLFDAFGVEAHSLIDPGRPSILDMVETCAEGLTPDDHLLITFSGHGATVENPGRGRLGERLALCPADVDRNGEDVTGVLHLGELVAALGKAAPLTTVVVDACYVGSGRRIERHLGTTRSEPDFGRKNRFAEARVLLACQPWEAALEVPSGAWQDHERMHGAFSYALTTLLQRWRAARDGRGRAYSTVQYGTLLDHARDFMRVLGLDQTPVLLGPPRLALVPVFHPTLAVEPGRTTPRPNRHLIEEQMGSDGDQFKIYIVRLVWSDAKKTTVAEVLSTGRREDGSDDDYVVMVDGKAVRFQAHSEYWRTTPFDLRDGVGLTRIEIFCDSSGRFGELDGLPSVAHPEGAFPIEWDPRADEVVVTALVEEMPGQTPEEFEIQMMGEVLFTKWFERPPSADPDGPRFAMALGLDDERTPRVRTVKWTAPKDVTPEDYFFNPKPGETIALDTTLEKSLGKVWWVDVK